MKKLIGLILVLAMVATVSLSALADTTNFATGDKPLGKIYQNGSEVGNVFDNRITITCGEILFPGVGPGNYTQSQLEKISSTWVEFKIYPNGMLPMVFAGGLTVNGKTYNSGVAAYVGGKTLTIKVRDGEIVLWSLLEDMHADIENRMAIQIQEGNLDYSRALNFKVCSAEVAGYFPTELLKSNKVEIIDP